MGTTCSKNEQQQDAENNAELQTEWTKAIWKTLEETIRRGQDITRELMMMMMIVMLKDKFYSGTPSPAPPKKEAPRTLRWQFYQHKSDVHWTACLFDMIRGYEAIKTNYNWVIGDDILKSPCSMFLRRVLLSGIGF